MIRSADCHPDRPNKGRGLCSSCYSKLPQIRAQQYAYAKTPNGKAARAKWSASKAGRAAARRRRIENTYDITLAQYDEMLANQNGVCAICQQPPKGGVPLAVDHCHVTGKVRGLLCIACNLVIGNAKEYLSVLDSAIKYLAKSKIEVRSPPNAKWPLVVYLNGLAVKVIHETGIVEDVDIRQVVEQQSERTA